jgi:hypothetical protein
MGRPGGGVSIFMDPLRDEAYPTKDTKIINYGLDISPNIRPSVCMAHIEQLVSVSLNNDRFLYEPQAHVSLPRNHNYHVTSLNLV